MTLGDLTEEQEAIVRAVTISSPLVERAGAWIMGVYVPDTGIELLYVSAMAEDVLRSHGIWPTFERVPDEYGDVYED